MPRKPISKDIMHFEPPYSTLHTRFSDVTHLETTIQGGIFIILQLPQP